MKKKIWNENSGITLIALVITIIILLILAGITIGTLMGENGILKQAITAEEETKKAQYKELIEIIIMEKKIERSQNPREEEPFIKVVADAINKKEWSKTVTICDEYGNTETEVEKCNKIIVETKDGYEIIINIDNEKIIGEIISITKGEAIKYKITFDANGGKGNVPEEMQIRKGFSIKLPKGEFLSQTDKKIVGWSIVKNPEEGKDKIYVCESSYQPNEEKTILYAIWAEDTVTITFDKNTGEGQMDSIIVGSGKSSMLPNNTFTKYGYYLKEWNTDIGGNGTSYADGGEIKVTEDTNLYAIWEEKIIASLSVTNNKFTEGTKTTLGGTAIAHGIEKIELKVGNNILYTEEVNGDFNYSKSNLGLADFNQTALKNLDFYDITVEMLVTSTTGKIGRTTLNIKNYTIGNARALNKLAEVVNMGNTLSGETVIQLSNIVTNSGYIPVGYYDGVGNWTGRYFAGIYDGKNHYIHISSYSSLTNYKSHGIFGLIIGGTVRNLTVKGAFGDGNLCGGIVGGLQNGTIVNCRNESTNSYGSRQ